MSHESTFSKLSPINVASDSIHWLAKLRTAWEQKHFVAEVFQRHKNLLEEYIKDWQLTVQDKWLVQFLLNYKTGISFTEVVAIQKEKVVLLSILFELERSIYWHSSCKSLGAISIVEVVSIFYECRQIPR
jgi:hypothetical protein